MALAEASGVRSMKVRDVMSADVREVPEEATLEIAARRMAELKVNSLVVRPEEKEEPYGILTSTDIVDAIAEGVEPAKTLVRDVASTPLVVITAGVPLRYAARLMRRANVRHLAVFNGREIVGVLSASDIVRAMGVVRHEETLA